VGESKSLCSMTALTMPAVPSGLNVRELPSRSGNRQAGRNNAKNSNGFLRIFYIRKYPAFFLTFLGSGGRVFFLFFNKK